MILNEFIQADTKGDFVIIKVNNKETLESMKSGSFWFWHPAFFNHQQNRYNNHSRGDANDNKSASIESVVIVESSSNTRLGYVEKRLFLNQDKMRQMSFYKLRLIPPKSYEPVDNRMTEFGDTFSMVKEQQLLKWLKGNGDFEVRSGECTYTNELQHHGAWGSFCKSLGYAYQKEHRLILSSNIFDYQIKADPIILDKSLQSQKFNLISCNNVLPDNERFDAHRNSCLIESEIESLKAQYCEKLNVSDDYLSDIYSLSDLIANNWTL